LLSCAWIVDDIVDDIVIGARACEMDENTYGFLGYVEERDVLESQSGSNMYSVYKSPER
jgi:hypothetical protein